MEHSKKFDMVKEYWVNQTWDEYRVGMAVEKGFITEKEFKEITGKDYE